MKSPLEQKLKVIFDSALEGMLICDKDMYIQEANQSAVNIFGRSITNAHRPNLQNFIIEKSQTKFNQTWNNFMKIGVVRSTMQIQGKNHSIRTLEYSGKAGILPGLHLLILRDITERIEEEIRKEHLLGLASHEIRTPLATMKVFVEIMKKNLAKGKYDTLDLYLSKVGEKTNVVIRLVNDLLDIARIRENRLDFFYESFSFDDFISETLNDLQLTIKTHTIILKGNTSTIMIADKHRITQVITNLIRNAVRYSPKAKKIIVTYVKKGKKVVISVQDFGIGIELKNQKKIFQLFYQADSTGKQRTFGIGVGLYIAKTIVEGHGGNIVVKSTRSIGSTFIVALPIHASLSKSSKKS